MYAAIRQKVAPWVAPWQPINDPLLMNRYPKRGKGFRWTVKELEAIGPTWKGDTLADGDGLQGDVRVNEANASVAWRYAYKWGGKTKRYYCGTWPTLSLEQVRANRDQAREWVKGGINPNDQKRAVRIDAQRKVEATLAENVRRQAEDLTFADLYDAWIADGVRRSDDNVELKRIFEKDVLTDLGSLALRNLSEHDVRAMLRKVVARGANRLAVVIFTAIRQMLAWGEKRKPWRPLLIEGNPTDLVEIGKIVDKDYDLANVRERVLSPEEIRELRDIFERMERDYAASSDKRRATRPIALETQVAIWLCLSTLTRIGETLKARWEHVDLKARTWYIPKENVKKTKAGQRALTIFLSDFATQQFERLHAKTGTGKWCFPARQREDDHVSESTVGKQIGDRQMMFMERKPLKGRRNDNSLVLAGGRKGNWTAHDLRRTGATLMETIGIEDKVIDLCQNHVIHTGNAKIRRHYLHSDHSNQMRTAWTALGSALEKALSAEPAL